MHKIESSRETIQTGSPGNKYQFLEAAYDRNIGFVSAAEQERLHKAAVAVPGLGGVGGSHVATMARLGIGRFHLADFDRFEPVNINRQYGARVTTFGRRKVDVLAEEAKAINPFVELKIFDEGVTPENVDAFLEGVDVVLDSMDFFNLEIRRLIFKRAWDRHIHVVTAGPVGFGSALLVFAPDRGMTFDRYFDLRDDMTVEEQLIAFFVGLAPKAAQKSYTLPGSISMAERRGPSLAAGCQMCAAAAAAEVVRILLDKPGLRPAPCFFQYDPFVRKFFQGKLRFGNRGPLQRWKRRILKSRLGSGSGFLQEPRPNAAIPSGPIGERLPEEVVDYLMQAAVRAPSGDNCQPWRYASQDDTIHLMSDPAADRSFFNVAQAASLISCGAAAENLIVAASRFGLQARVRIETDADQPRFDIRLTGRGVPEDPLLRFIWVRHTNRTLYDRSPLDPALGLQIKKAVEPFEDVRLVLHSDPSRLKEAARLVGEIDRIRVEHRGLHTHLMQMIRFTDQEAADRRDGFPLKNLEAGSAGEWFLRVTRPWPVMNLMNHLGMGKMISRISCQGMQSASAVGLLKVPSCRPEHLMIGGRALERLWLTVTRLGLSFQPMTAATLFWLRWQTGGRNDFAPEHRRLLEAIWPRYRRLYDVRKESEGHVLMFRIGKGRPVSCRTLRKPLSAFRLPLGGQLSGGHPEAPEAPEALQVISRVG